VRSHNSSGSSSPLPFLPVALPRVLKPPPFVSSSGWGPRRHVDLCPFRDIFFFFESFLILPVRFSTCKNSSTPRPPLPLSFWAPLQLYRGRDSITAVMDDRASRPEVIFSHFLPHFCAGRRRRWWQTNNSPLGERFPPRYSSPHFLLLVPAEASRASRLLSSRVSSHEDGTTIC